jgi:hypothetical protein
VAKRLTVDLPDSVDRAVLVVVLWSDKRGRTAVHVHHKHERIPFEVAREALVNALAQIEPDGADRGKFTRGDARGLEFADTPETRKVPS